MRSSLLPSWSLCWFTNRNIAHLLLSACNTPGWLRSKQTSSKDASSITSTTSCHLQTPRPCLNAALGLAWLHRSRNRGSVEKPLAVLPSRPFAMTLPTRMRATLPSICLTTGGDYTGISIIRDSLWWKLCGDCANHHQAGFLKYRGLLLLIEHVHLRIWNIYLRASLEDLTSADLERISLSNPL